MDVHLFNVQSHLLKNLFRLKKRDLQSDKLFECWRIDNEIIINHSILSGFHIRLDVKEVASDNIVTIIEYQYYLYYYWEKRYKEIISR